MQALSLHCKAISLQTSLVFKDSRLGDGGRPGDDQAVRAKLSIAIAILGLAAAIAVVAAAQPAANGLPAYTNGYTSWPTLKRIAIKGPNAHVRVKTVYSNKRKTGKTYPVGTVIVKDIVEPGNSYVSQVAVMRKVKSASASGGWTFVEFTRPSRTGRYGVLARGELCSDCHMLAKRNDWVFRAR
jgi:hypothetical protein